MARSQELTEVRNKLVEVRNSIRSLNIGEVEGSLTCTIVVLHNRIEEAKGNEIAQTDSTRGKHVDFRVRGIGQDRCPGCFICGGESMLYNNISAFVSSKEDGERVVGWFSSGAWLDYRPEYPHRVQVKIGACDAHLEHLKKLEKSIGQSHSVIREADVLDSQSPFYLEQ